MKSFLFLSSYCAGTVEYYDKTYDRITTRSEKPLEGNNRIFHKVTTTDDPIIRKVLIYKIHFLIIILYLIMGRKYFYMFKIFLSNEIVICHVTKTN